MKELQMAKPRKSDNGTYQLTVNFKRKRCTLTIGKVRDSEAHLFAANVDCFIQHRKHRGRLPVSPIVDGWIQTLSRTHREQLSNIGLLNDGDLDLTVGELIKKFLKDYDTRQLRPSTKIQFRTVMEHRIPESLKSKKVSNIEPKRECYRPNATPVFSADTKALFLSVESWQREHYAKSSWSRANGRLREVGVWAVANGICDYNPFSLARSPGEVNPERNVYVEKELVENAISNCNDADTRLSFVLGRFAAFRLPSEALTLQWSHIDFVRRQLQILDSKKLEFRVMPLFDRLYDELIGLRALSPDGRYVFSQRFRKSSNSNNFILMKKAIKRAGIIRWPRMRQNLRASCENDFLNSGFDERVVTQWVGHTVQISRKHYQKSVDDDYIRAVEQARIAGTINGSPKEKEHING